MITEGYIPEPLLTVFVGRKCTCAEIELISFRQNIDEERLQPGTKNPYLWNEDKLHLCKVNNEYYMCLQRVFSRFGVNRMYTVNSAVGKYKLIASVIGDCRLHIFEGKNNLLYMGNDKIVEVPLLKRDLQFILQ